MSGKKMVACSRVTDEEGGDDGRFRFTSFFLKKGIVGQTEEEGGEEVV